MFSFNHLICSLCVILAFPLFRTVNKYSKIVQFKPPLPNRIAFQCRRHKNAEAVVDVAVYNNSTSKRSTAL